MEQTLLESKLEQTLLTLEMPLDDRIYAEDLDFEAEIEDLITQTKSTDSLLDQIFGDTSGTQMRRGEQELFKRFSLVYNGLGIVYSVDSSNHKLGEKNPARPQIDKIIRERDFGDFGAEILDIYYSSDSLYKLANLQKRYVTQLTTRFYEDTDTNAGTIYVTKNNIINVDTNFSLSDFETVSPLTNFLFDVRLKFNGVYLDENNADKLMYHLNKLKQLL